MQVLIAGGTKTLVYGNLQRKLATHGIQIGWYVSDMDSKTYTGIPSGCEGIIVLRDMISHGLSGMVVADANKFGLPNACIERKWAKAASTLKLQGFPVIIGGEEDSDLPPTDEEIQQVVTACVVGARRDRREPSFSEVQGVLQDQLGPEISLTWECFNKAKAAASVEFITLTDPGDQQAKARLEVGLIIESNVELVLDVPALMALSKQNFPESTDLFTESLVKQAIDDARTIWQRDVPLARDQHKWLVSRYRQYKETGKGWIGSSDSKLARDIFGRFLNWSEAVQDARSEVYGAWASHMVILGPTLEQHLRKLAPDVPADINLRVEADQGRLNAILLPHGKWFSSEAAVVEYAATYYPKKSTSDLIVADLDNLIPPSTAKPSVPLTVSKEVMETVSDIVDSLGVTPPPTRQSQNTDDLYALADLIEVGFSQRLQGTHDKLAELQATVQALQSLTTEAVDTAAAEVIEKVRHFLSGVKVTLADSDRKVVRAIVDQALDPILSQVRAVATSQAQSASWLVGSIGNITKVLDEQAKTLARISVAQQHQGDVLVALGKQMTEEFRVVTTMVEQVQADVKALQTAPTEAKATPEKSGGVQEGLDPDILALAKSLRAARGAEVRLFLGEVNTRD